MFNTQMQGQSTWMCRPAFVSLSFQTAYSRLLFSNTSPGRRSKSDRRTPKERCRSANQAQIADTYCPLPHFQPQWYQ